MGVWLHIIKIVCPHTHFLVLYHLLELFYDL